MQRYILALDQGTTSSRAILFGRDGSVGGHAQQPFRQYYPQPGWVEHDPNEIWESERAVAAQALRESGLGRAVAAIGITNQRETTILWDRATGEPIHNAIVWQCRRTADIADALREKRGVSELVAEKTGLHIDAYFSATKIKWLLDHVPSARERAERGEILFGTVETWLIWRLTGGKVHVTDYSNASRTMLFNIHTLSWDEELCALLDIPMNILPRPVSNSEVYGTVAEGIEGLEELAGVPICGAAGDQQAALFGQGCFTRGQAKNTYGTGCFTLMNVGGAPVRSRAGLVTTVGWSLNGETTYALEGSVFNAGSAIQWLRDELQVISTSHECDILAESVPDSGGIYLVHGPRCAVLGYVCARLRRGHHARHDEGALRPRSARIHRLSGHRPDDRHAAGRRLRDLPSACRRRRERQRFDDAVSGGFAAHSGRPARDGRDDGVWRGIARGSGRGRVEGLGRAEHSPVQRARLHPRAGAVRV